MRRFSVGASLDREGYIYATAFTEPNVIKLGASQDPHKRAKELLASRFNPHVIAMAAAETMSVEERLLHWIFRDYVLPPRCRSYEWFEIDPDHIVSALEIWPDIRSRHLASLPADFSIRRYVRDRVVVA